MVVVQIVYFHGSINYVHDLWYILDHAVIAGGSPGADRDWGQ